MICPAQSLAFTPYHVRRTHAPPPLRYRADPPLLELDGDSVSALSVSPLHIQPEVPAAAIVPAGLVAQRRKSFSDHPAAAQAQRSPFVPEITMNIVTSAGYVNVISQSKSSGAGADHAGGVVSASSSNRQFSFGVGAAVELALPSASEPASNLAPTPQLHLALAAAPPTVMPSSSQVFDILPQQAAVVASSAQADCSVAQVESPTCSAFSVCIH